MMPKAYTPSQIRTIRRYPCPSIRRSCKCSAILLSTSKAQICMLLQVCSRPMIEDVAISLPLREISNRVFTVSTSPTATGPQQSTTVIATGHSSALFMFILCTPLPSECAPLRRKHQPSPELAPPCRRQASTPGQEPDLCRATGASSVNYQSERRRAYPGLFNTHLGRCGRGSPKLRRLIRLSQLPRRE